MAAAMGARVYPGDRGPGIGWFPIQPSTDGPSPTWFKLFLDSDLYLFHWHVDTFDIPQHAARLAETQLYSNQAFMVGNLRYPCSFIPK